VGQSFGQSAARVSTILEHLGFPEIFIRFPTSFLLFEFSTAVGNSPAGRRDRFPETPIQIEGRLPLLLSSHRSIIACGRTAWLT
jgi:hypothetical protein